MRFRAEVDEFLDDKTEKAMRGYFRKMGLGGYVVDVHASGEYISERLRRYMMGLVRLIYNYHVNELGEADLTIRKILHEIEDELNPEYDIVIHSGGVPLSRWYSKEALNIKDKLQAIYGPRGLFLPDPSTNYKEE